MSITFAKKVEKIFEDAFFCGRPFEERSPTPLQTFKKGLSLIKFATALPRSVIRGNNFEPQCASPRQLLPHAVRYRQDPARTDEKVSCILSCHPEQA